MQGRPRRAGRSGSPGSPRLPRFLPLAVRPAPGAPGWRPLPAHFTDRTGGSAGRRPHPPAPGPAPGAQACFWAPGGSVAARGPSTHPCWQGGPHPHTPPTPVGEHGPPLLPLESGCLPGVSLPQVTWGHYGVRSGGQAAQAHTRLGPRAGCWAGRPAPSWTLPQLSSGPGQADHPRGRGLTPPTPGYTGQPPGHSPLPPRAHLTSGPQGEARDPGDHPHSALCPQPGHGHQRPVRPGTPGTEKPSGPRSCPAASCPDPGTPPPGRGRPRSRPSHTLGRSVCYEPVFIEVARGPAWETCSPRAGSGWGVCRPVRREGEAEAGGATPLLPTPAGVNPTKYSPQAWAGLFIPGAPWASSRSRLLAGAQPPRGAPAGRAGGGDSGRPGSEAPPALRGPWFGTPAGGEASPSPGTRSGRGRGEGGERGASAPGGSEGPGFQPPGPGPAEHPAQPTCAHSPARVRPPSCRPARAGGTRCSGRWHVPRSRHGRWRRPAAPPPRPDPTP